MRFLKIVGLVLAVALGLLVKTFYDQSKRAEAALAESKKWGEEVERDLKRNQDAARLLQAEMATPPHLERLPDVKITYRPPPTPDAKPRSVAQRKKKEPSAEAGETRSEGAGPR